MTEISNVAPFIYLTIQHSYLPYLDYDERARLWVEGYIRAT